jgi:aquaporin NIP
LPRPPLARRALAEGLATFALVFASCGAIVVNAERGGSLGPVGNSLAAGLVIMAMIYATGHLSGAHFNPAVTIAFTAVRHFPLREAIVYIPAQLAGGLAGAVTLRLVWDGTPANLGATLPSVGVGAALTYELILTAFLMFVIMAVATDSRAVGAAAAIAIGGTIGLNSLYGGGVTGASMNPARSFGPALVASEWTDFWIYIVGPLSGALAGAVLYQLVRGETAHARPPTETIERRDDALPQLLRQ